MVKNGPYSKNSQKDGKNGQKCRRQKTVKTFNIGQQQSTAVNTVINDKKQSKTVKNSQKRSKTVKNSKKNVTNGQKNVANISFSILGDMEMHKWLWKCMTETNVMENIKWVEI